MKKHDLQKFFNVSKPARRPQRQLWAALLSGAVLVGSCSLSACHTPRQSVGSSAVTTTSASLAATKLPSESVGSKPSPAESETMNNSSTSSAAGNSSAGSPAATTRTGTEQTSVSLLPLDPITDLSYRAGTYRIDYEPGLSEEELTVFLDHESWRTYDGDKSFGEFNSEKFDEAFFRQNILLLWRSTSRSGSMRPTFEGFSEQNGIFYPRASVPFLNQQQNTPGSHEVPVFGTCDMAGWLIVIELSRSGLPQDIQAGNFALETVSFP